jgi:two-component system OmpR family response regulator
MSAFTPSRDRTDVIALDLAERVERLEELLYQRPIQIRETMLQVGPLQLDLIEHTVRRTERTIHLLPREFRLLKYMMQHSDQLLERVTLLRDVWHYNFAAKTNLVDVHVGRLRHKVDGPDEVRMILSVRGAGFILLTPS